MPEAKDRILPFPNLIYRVLSFRREIQLEPSEIFEPQPKEYLLIDQVGEGTVRRRRGDHTFGVSLAQDIQYAASLLIDIASLIKVKCFISCLGVHWLYIVVNYIMSLKQGRIC